MYRRRLSGTFSASLFFFFSFFFLEMLHLQDQSRSLLLLDGSGVRRWCQTGGDVQVCSMVNGCRDSDIVKPNYRGFYRSSTCCLPSSASATVKWEILILKGPKSAPVLQMYFGCVLKWQITIATTSKINFTNICDVTKTRSPPTPWTGFYCTTYEM